MIPSRIPNDRSPRQPASAPDRSRWAHPGFLVSAGVIAVVVALAIYLAVGNIRGTTSVAAAGTSAAPITTPIATPITTPTDTTKKQAAASICGIAAPTGDAASIDTEGVTWRYSNAFGYPVSSVYGPRRKDPAGFQYCFQHSAGGALLAAADSLAFDNADQAETSAWAKYILADGPYRSQILQQIGPATDTGGRAEIIGYRMRSYSPDEAWVDIAVRVSDSDQTALGSVIFDLVWQRGDWRISTDQPEPMNSTQVGDLTGYTAWGAA